MSQYKSILVGIDYDGTWSEDPAFFQAFVGLLRSFGHHAVIVTGRKDVGAMGEEVRAAVGKLPIVFCDMSWKREAAKEAGYKVDIWIDDFPEFVGNQAGLTLAMDWTREGLYCETCGEMADRWIPVCDTCHPMKIESFVGQ